MNYKLKRGFTLAEVLITIAIVGVVAAMTIPTLVSSYQKKLFETKVKYTYSLLANVVERSVADGGDIKTWDYGDSYRAEDTGKFVKLHFEPYFQVLDSGISSTYYYYTKLKNGITITWQFDGGSSVGKPPTAIYAIGSFNGNTSRLTDETRNYSRYDFVMTIQPSENKLAFFNWGGNTREGVKNTSIYACNTDTAPNMRLNCGKLLQMDNFKIETDYPW